MCSTHDVLMLNLKPTPKSVDAPDNEAQVSKLVKKARETKQEALPQYYVDPGSKW